ncbi:MAG: hypothetical protein ABW047_09635 [Nitrospiraceae bacterium]
MMGSRFGQMVGFLIATSIASAVGMVSHMNGPPFLLAAGEVATGLSSRKGSSVRRARRKLYYLSRRRCERGVRSVIGGQSDSVKR